MKVHTAEEIREIMTHIINYYEEVKDRYIIDYITDTRLAYLEDGEEADIYDTLRMVLDYLHFNLAIYEDLQEFELCELINKVIHIEIAQMTGFLKRRDLYKEEYKLAFEVIRIESRETWLEIVWKLKNKI